MNARAIGFGAKLLTLADDILRDWCLEQRLAEPKREETADE